MFADDDESNLLSNMFEDPAEFYLPPPKPGKIKFLMNNETKSEIVLESISKHSLWGHLLWNGAKVIAECIDKKLLFDVCRKRVLEFGAATALPSIVACLHQADMVTITDYPEAEILNNILKNVNTNIPSPDENEFRFEVKGHKWGNDVSSLIASGKYDIIIMADLIATHGAHRDLLQSCKACLKPSGFAVVSFGHHRVHMIDKDMDFFRLAKSEFGFDVRQILEVRKEAMFPNDPGDLLTREMTYVYILSIKQ